MDAHALHRGDPDYPDRLAAVTHAPTQLWVSGSYSAAPRAVAVVGARAASRKGIELAEGIGFALGRAKADAISGGAIGIDAALHRGALRARGVTVAVLGTGIDVIYPARHAGLFAEIVASEGALLTQFPPGMAARRGSFPARNAIIAGLADLIVVVEAGLESGSLYTARFARAFGRNLAAVPGSAGTDALLVDKAQVARTPEDVLALLEGKSAAPLPLPEHPAAERVYAAMDHTPRDVGDLAFRAGLAVGTCAAVVIDLELGGLAARAAGGRYLRLR